jgi:hypothetical protein
VAIWKARRTLLLVGEGYHEEAFLNHVKHLYVSRGCGLSVTVKNARGKSAAHIIEWTIRQINNAAYDDVAVMLDTDTDWSPALAKQAKRKGIQVLASEPCFDALMLRLLGKNAVGEAAALKKLLSQYLKNEPTERESYAEHFGMACLEKGRQHEPSIDVLLKLLGV